MGDDERDWKRILHRLRSPLAVVHTTASVLREKPDGTTLGELRRHLHLIEEGVRDAAEILDELDTALDGHG